MVKNVNPSLGARYLSQYKQTEKKQRTELTPANNIYRLEISDEARTASKTLQNELAQGPVTEEQDDTLEQKLAEYTNTGGLNKTEETDDTTAKEARRKLAAMRIAMRIAKGDNVPMQDHRFLAEYDSKLYKTALKASLMAQNNDPKDHDSIIDELLAEEQAEADAKASREAKNATQTTDNQTTEAPEESADAQH